MSSALITVGAPLVGTMIGGTITYVTTWRADKRRVRDQDTRQQKAQSREIVQAARLVLEELRQNLVRADVNPDGKTVMLVADEEWMLHRHTLAGIDDAEAWKAIAATYATLERLKAYPGQLEIPPMEIRAQMGPAMSALVKLIGEEP